MASRGLGWSHQRCWTASLRTFSLKTLASCLCPGVGGSGGGDGGGLGPGPGLVLDLQEVGSDRRAPGRSPSARPPVGGAVASARKLNVL